MKKPFSQACENNKQPILKVLTRYFADRHTVLEIGSGSGQHAVFFAERLPGITWQPSDLPENLSGLRLWIDEVELENIKPPVKLNVLSNPWPDDRFDAAYTANTSHIMSLNAVSIMFQQLGKRLPAGGIFCQYGPFNYEGQFTSDSNARFDTMLRQREKHMGIRDFDDIASFATDNGFELLDDVEMPANNRILVWQKI